MGEVLIVGVQPGSTELRGVMRLHKAAKATLGFLPDQGFNDRAERGTLLAAVEDDRVIGYVLFDVTGDRVRVRHLCVDPKKRKHGVARRLIEELKRGYRERRGIVLDCRRDYGLADMWHSLGFRVVSERRGRSLAGHPLSLWEIDFGHPTLFSEAPVVGDLTCLDQMILEDLVTDRPAGRDSRNLDEDWVSELVELCVTDEVFRESNATEDAALRARLLTAAHRFRNLSKDDENWKRHVPDLAAMAPGAGRADHCHVARAIEGGAAYFVTRDGALLKGASAIAERLGVLIVSPAGLLDRLDRQRAQDRYEPVALEATELSEERLSEAMLGDFVSALINHGEGERSHTLRDTVNRAYANPVDAQVMAIRDRDGTILGGVVRTVEDDRLLISALRVRRTGSLTDAVARQLVFLQRKVAADRRLGRVVVEDRALSPAVRRALPVEFFEEEDEGIWACTVRVGRVAAAEVFSPEHAVTVYEAAAFERRHWPVKVVGAGIPTYMVSIEPSFAEELIDAELAGAKLFARTTSLGLSREQVYYRSSATWRKRLSGPARVLWYVKQKKPAHPVGHVRAVSHLVDVVCDRPRTLHKRYARLGVWSQQKVEEAAGRRGEAMALHVMDTERLERPLSLDTLREVYASEGLRFQAPQGPIGVSERMFCLLYGRSSAYA